MKKTFLVKDQEPCEMCGERECPSRDVWVDMIGKFVSNPVFLVAIVILLVVVGCLLVTA